MRALWPGVVGRHLYWIGVLVHDSHQAAGFLLCVTCFVESLHDGVQLRFDVQADDVQSGFLLQHSAVLLTVNQRHNVAGDFYWCYLNT